MNKKINERLDAIHAELTGRLEEIRKQALIQAKAHQALADDLDHALDIMTRYMKLNGEVISDITKAING